MLIRCQKCERPVSTGTEDCPYCGHDVRRAKKTIWFKIACVAGFYLAISVAGLAMLKNRSGENEQVLAVVRANVEAINRKDLVALVDLIHPESRGRQELKDTAKFLFQSYELRCTLERATIESMDEREARVRFSQVTRKISGPEFKNNRVSGIHVLRKFNGQWKLFDTVGIPPANGVKVDFLEQ